jgi:hypothetical protein
MPKPTSAPVSKEEVMKAQAHLNRMRRSLVAWLKYRRWNDDIATGKRQTTKPRALALQIVKQQRDWATEQKLADQLHVLLSEVMPDAPLPEPDVTANPNAAVILAQIAITGRLPATVASPEPTGANPAWLWPVLIVGGLLLAVTTAIGSIADVAKSKEEYACIQAGACTDYGFWLKIGGVAMIGWLLWTQTSLKDTIGRLGTAKGG